MKDNIIKDKLYRNALIIERLNKLNKKERQIIITNLLKKKSERELSEEIGISHSTIHDWKTLRQNNTGQNMHLSLTHIIKKLKEFTPVTNFDYTKLNSIKDIVEQKLRKKILE